MVRKGGKIAKEGHVSLLPVIEAIRKAGYIYITNLLVWNITLEDAAVVSLVITLLFSHDAIIQLPQLSII